MVKAQILTFARIKPPEGEHSRMNYSLQGNKLIVQIRRNGKSGPICNLKEEDKFPFTQVFDQSSSQEDIFARVARPVVLSCLEGYNGTIFAYGQTGSGKTYTMNGGESWRTRGIIPRVLSLLYDEYEKRKDCQFRTYVSYLEIYKENGYDLLDKRHVDVPFKDWNKVGIDYARFRYLKMMKAFFICRISQFMNVRAKNKHSIDLCLVILYVRSVLLL